MHSYHLGKVLITASLNAAAPRAMMIHETKTLRDIALDAALDITTVALRELQREESRPKHIKRLGL